MRYLKRFNEATNWTDENISELLPLRMLTIRVENFKGENYYQSR